MTERFLTTKQVAELLGLHPITLARMRMNGTGPAFIVLSRRAVRYRESDLSAWLAARTKHEPPATEATRGSYGSAPSEASGVESPLGRFRQAEDSYTGASELSYPANRDGSDSARKIGKSRRSNK